MSSNGLVEAFTISESAEMERAPPAIFVNVRGKVVIVPGKSGIFCFSCLIDLLARAMESIHRARSNHFSDFCSLEVSGLVVPMSVAALCATWSLFSIDRKPLESTDLPCITLLNAASRE